MTSFLKMIKRQILPMKVGVTCSLIFVENFRFIFSLFAYTISHLFVTSQIVKRYFFNIGLSLFAKSPKPSKGLHCRPFFYFHNLTRC